MTGSNAISIIAIFCYFFLLATFAGSREKSKVIRSFMQLLSIMILWVGGSFAMRAQLWPGVNFWHHVSVGGMSLLAAGYFHFVLDFLEEKNGHGRWFWMIFHLALFVFDCVTCFFIPEPVLQTDAMGKVQFIYTYDWPIYLLFAFILIPVAQMGLIIYRHCKGNRIAYQQLKPIIVGVGVMLLGHAAATLPVFAGFPLDIVSGVANTVFIFYALYKKHLFRITLLLSRLNYLLISLALCGLVLYRTSDGLIAWLQRGLHLGYTGAVVAAVAVFVLTVLAMYAIIAAIFSFTFARREKARQASIDRFAEDINHMLSVTAILQNLTEVIQNTCKVERMMILMRQEDGDYRVEHTTNPLEEKSFYLSPDHPLLTYLVGKDQCVRVEDFVRSTVYRCMWEKEKEMLSRLHLDSIIPLRTEGELVGLILLSAGSGSLRYHDLSTAETVASLCAAAVKNAYVYEHAIEEARTDELTGLINRKFFFDLLDEEFEKYQDTALSLCLLNLDDFKVYNQLYGTVEGDIALQRVAGLLRSGLNDACHAARIGGKEFALILPGYDIYSAKLLTENLVSEISLINGRGGGSRQPITVSAGICAAPYMASTARELFANAETAVYTVKRSGKNAVQIYSSEIYHQQAQQFTYRSGYGENASTIYALTAAIDAKDHYTFQHSQNVAYYAGALAKEAGLDSDLVEIVKEAGLLHDIGKIGIREDILNKPGKLTMEEYEVMKGHVENAVNIIRYLPSLDYVIPTVLAHHERYDGRGYPRRLAGEEIPIMARILCIADSFDAMTSERTYKKALSKEEALAILHEEAGKQFDPKLAIIFSEMVEKGEVEVRGQAPTPAGDHPEGQMSLL